MAASPLWATGFRPFFLLAPAVAIALLSIWVLVLSGALQAPGHLHPITWHAHELVFGYTMAVVAGFLLTAARNWTGQATAHGASLVGLTVLWLAGRVLLALPTGSLPPALVAAVDVAFLPALAFFVGRPIIKTRRNRNYGLVALLLLAAVLNALIHADALSDLTLPTRGLAASVDVVMLFMLVIGGRVVPMFTANRLGTPSQRSPRWAQASLGLATALLIADVAGLDEEITRWIAIAAAVATLARMRGWQSRATLGVPMLWVLHVGYLWLVVSLLLRGAVGWIPELAPSMATHAMTAGAVGTLTLGMMARVSLGHTGRRIAANRLTTAAFAAMVLAGIVRVFGPLLPLDATPIHGVAGGLWVASMVIFLVVYAPILVSPRADGKPG